MINLITTTSTEHLGKLLAKNENIRLFSLGKNNDGKRIFPDGEVYTALREVQEIKGRTVILHSGMPDPNNGLVELEMLISILKDAGISEIEIFFSYFPYGMQDKVFSEGETNAAENLIKKLVNYFGISKIYILDAHFHGMDWVKKYPIVDVTAVSLLKEKVLQKYPEIIFVAPDTGSQRRTKLTGSSKNRRNSHEVDIHHDEEFGRTLKGKVVGVVDDLIETGGTMVRFADKCFEYGAKAVIALATHGVLESGIEKIQNRYSELHLTNSIDRSAANIDVSEIIFEALDSR